jgi:uncharacterized membrane protein YvbJ
MNDESSLICPDCSTANAPDAKRCTVCGHPFDALGHILDREQLRFVDRFSQHAQAVPETKAQQADGSRQRMAQLWEEDRQRRDALYAQKRRQQQQERRLLMGAVTAVIVVLIVVLIVLLAKGG